MTADLAGAGRTDGRPVPDDSQRRAVEHGRGTLLVTGPPGSGKTAALRERFARLVEHGVAPEQIALFVLDRRAAREARDRIVRRLARSVPELPVFTAHGYAVRLIGRRFAELGYAAAPVVLSAAEQYATVRELLAHEPPEAWPRFGRLLGVRGFARQVADFVLRAQERLLGPAALLEAVRPGEAEVARFYERYLDVMNAAGRVDFGGVLHQAVALLHREVTPEDRFAHLLVDDYQDATPALAAILTALAAHAESVVVAADPGGQVFGFRGSSAEPLAGIEESFGAVERVELSERRRSGDVTEARLYAHPGEEADAVAHEILRARVDEDVPWEHAAVVVRRHGSYVAPLRHALARHGIPFVVVGEASEIATEPANRPVIELLRYALPGAERAERAERLEPLLSGPVGGLDPHRLRRLRREARIRNVSLASLVHEADLSHLLEDLKEPVERFRSIVADLTKRIGRDRPDAVFFELWTRLPHAARAVAEESHRDLDALVALSEALARFAEHQPGATIAHWLETLETAEFGPEPFVPPEERYPRAVRILSAHRAHGQEFDVVIVAGCVEGEFPAAARTRRLVDLDEALAPKTAAERRKESLAEERRLFRLATSRARRRTVLFASHSAHASNPRTPSRFADALGLAWTRPDPDAGPVTSLRALEATHRRRLADASGGAPGLERLVALGAIGELARLGATDPAAWWGARDWTDNPAPLYPEKIHTSYSRLSSMENCGLQYLYAVEMGLDPAQTHAMWVGSVVHDIIDRAQRGEIAWDAGALHAALDEVWDPEQFPSRAIEHRRLIDAREMLARRAEHEQQEVARSEAPFGYEFEGAVIRGKIDAIFRQSNGRLRIVDFKTGRTADKAKDSLQLAVYYLASLRDEELRTLGEVAHLELAYIALARRREGYYREGIAVPTGYQEQAEEKLRALLAKIRAEQFAPSPEADCQWCRFKTLCPLWPEGQEALR